ncbi:MAG: P1 family peptidase [Anaerolineae bacterium]
MSDTRYNAITDVDGIKVGHATDSQALTGCTVVLCEKGAVAGVDVRGSAPGTRETDLLAPTNLVEKVHAILLTGGSAYGLAAADGVMRWLEERGVGFPVGVGVVPIVPGAVLFDLALGDPKVRPSAQMGYAACRSASGGPVEEGNVGAGTGATVGKLFGLEWAMKGGLGTASVELRSGAIVAALVAVNAFGDVVDPSSGRILAGARQPEGGFVNTALALQRMAFKEEVPGTLEVPGTFPTNTTIGVIATDARLTKAQATKLAQMAHDGLARAVRPAHTLFDGDTIFALSLGEKEAPLNALGAAAARAVEEAILRGIRTAEGVGGIPAWRDLGVC